MTIAVDMGRKATKTNKQTNKSISLLRHQKETCSIYDTLGTSGLMIFLGECATVQLSRVLIFQTTEL